MVEKSKRLNGSNAKIIATQAINEYFRIYSISEAVKNEIAASFGPEKGGWIFDYSRYSGIPKDIEPDTVCVDDPRLNPPKLLFRVHVRSEAYQVIVEEFNSDGSLKREASVSIIQ